jgi:hypothetical protein
VSGGLGSPAPLTDQEGAILDFMNGIVDNPTVPARGRMVVYTVALLRFVGQEPTVAEIAAELGVSEDVARKRVVELLQSGALSWTPDGIRLAIPGIGE